MALLTASRNTPEWNGAPRFHYGLIGVEASTSIYVGGMVAIDASGFAVPAQGLGASPLNRLEVLGICEYVYAGGILPPGINALNQTGNGTLYPGATATLGTAGAIGVGVVASIFGMDVDTTITAARVGMLCYASDDHIVSLGTLIANTTSIVMPAAGSTQIVVLRPHIVPGTFDAYSLTGGGGTRYVEGTDYAVDYQGGLFMALSGSAIAAGATVFITYYHGARQTMAGEIVAIDAGLAYVSFLSHARGFGF